MRFLTLLVAGLVVAGPVAAGDTQTAPAPQLPWPLVESKAAIDFAPYYPQRAIDDGVSGEALVSCVVAATGKVQDCQVEGQSPVGYGFGQAAAKAIGRYAVVDLERYHLKAGDRVAFDHKWERK